MTEKTTHQDYFTNRELDALPMGQKMFTAATPMTKVMHRTWATETLSISYPQSKLCFTRADNPHVEIPDETNESAPPPETDPVDAKLLAVVEERFDQGPAAVAEAIKQELNVSIPITRPLRRAPEPVWPSVGDIWVGKEYRHREPVRVTELSKSENYLGMNFVRCALVSDISAVGNLIPLSFFNREFTFVAAEPEQPSVGEIWAQKCTDCPDPGAHYRITRIKEYPGSDRVEIHAEALETDHSPVVSHGARWKSFFGFIGAE